MCSGHILVLLNRKCRLTVRDTTWLSAAMCHLCKCHSEKIEIWYTLLILTALDLVLNHNAKEIEASYTDHLNVNETKFVDGT